MTSTTDTSYPMGHPATGEVTCRTFFDLLVQSLHAKGTQLLTLCLPVLGSTTGMTRRAVDPDDLLTPVFRYTYPEGGPRGPDLPFPMGDLPFYVRDDGPDDPPRWDAGCIRWDRPDYTHHIHSATPDGASTAWERVVKDAEATFGDGALLPAAPEFMTGWCARVGELTRLSQLEGLPAVIRAYVLSSLHQWMTSSAVPVLVHAGIEAGELASIIRPDDMKVRLSFDTSLTVTVGCERLFDAISAAAAVRRVMVEQLGKDDDALPPVHVSPTGLFARHRKKPPVS